MDDPVWNNTNTFRNVGNPTEDDPSWTNDRLLLEIQVLLARITQLGIMIGGGKSCTGETITDLGTCSAPETGCGTTAETCTVTGSRTETYSETNCTQDQERTVTVTQPQCSRPEKEL